MLPFSKQPIDFTVFETIDGPFHLLKLGYIMVQEQAAIDSELLESSQVQLRLLKILQKICTEENISREEAAGILDNPLANPVISSKYVEEIEEVLQIQADLGAKSRLQEVTTIIRHRAINPDAFDADGKILASWEILRRDYLGIPDWDTADTLSLDQELYQQISEFADQERMAKKQRSRSFPSQNISKDLSSTSAPESSTGVLSTGE
jgi:hypothetical protein